jgi:hypothetical protein
VSTLHSCDNRSIFYLTTFCVFSIFAVAIYLLFPISPLFNLIPPSVVYAAADTAPPTIRGTISSNTELNVPQDTRLYAGFSEPIQTSTITTGTFTLKNTATNINVPGTLTFYRGYDNYFNGGYVEFKPSSLLSPYTTYVATFVAGGIKD